MNIAFVRNCRVIFDTAMKFSCPTSFACLPPVWRLPSWLGAKHNKLKCDRQLGERNETERSRDMRYAEICWNPKINSSQQLNEDWVVDSRLCSNFSHTKYWIQSKSINRFFFSFLSLNISSFNLSWKLNFGDTFIMMCGQICCLMSALLQS